MLNMKLPTVNTIINITFEYFYFIYDDTTCRLMVWIAAVVLWLKCVLIGDNRILLKACLNKIIWQIKELCSACFLRVERSPQDHVEWNSRRRSCCCSLFLTETDASQTMLLCSYMSITHCWTFIATKFTDVNRQSRCQSLCQVKCHLGLSVESCTSSVPIGQSRENGGG